MGDSLSRLLNLGARSYADAYASTRHLGERPSFERIDGRNLRIGYLNPWRDKAENQAFKSLEIAAGRLGISLIYVTTSAEIETAGLDFVIAVASTQPKTTSVPTFGSIHEPRTRFFSSESFFQNLLSYDGYLTISDTLESFCKSIAAGFGGWAETGFYYNTPHMDHRASPVESLAERRALRLCYFGTNWDSRGRALFRALSERPYTRIYGPEGSWSYLERGYCGSVPFDGVSVQEEYCKFGAGLVMLAKDHLLDDVISNRIFEISAVGAVAICPDIPWIRRNFDDAVYYYPAHGTTQEILAAIDTAIDRIHAEPETARRRAREAREVFERRFCAERMLLNAVDHFDRWRETVGRPGVPSDDPLIDVIVRVGGRPISTIRRAVDSIEAQRAGRFRVIFVRYRAVDLSSILADSWSRIQDFKVVDALKGGRAVTMTAGLKAVTAPFFAFLDDDDMWLSHHVGALLAQTRRLPEGRAYAYSGYMSEGAAGLADFQLADERRRIETCAPASGMIWDILGRLQTGAFLASSALLSHVDLDGWTMQSAEDSLLHGSLIANAEPAFSWRASVCWTADSADRSNYVERSSRQEDVFECFTRMGAHLDRIEHKFAGRSMAPWERLAITVRDVFEAKTKQIMSEQDILVLEEGTRVAPLEDRHDLNRALVMLGGHNVSVGGASRLAGEDRLEILPPAQAWAFGAVILPPEIPGFEGPHWVVLEFDRLYGSYGVGVLDRSGEFMTRMEAPVLDMPMQLWLHVKNPRDAASIVIHNWTGASTEPAILRRMWTAWVPPGGTASQSDGQPAQVEPATPSFA